MPDITDVIIQSTSGIPFVARCFGGTYCQNQPNHSLISGFFAAINSFKGEFQQNRLTIVGFDKLQLIFESENNILVILGIENHSGDDKNAVRSIAREISNEFIKRHGVDISRSKTIQLEIFDDFAQWVDKKIERN
ncbi:MAG: hypothetical protein ACXAD7_24010 [Candidatus Kariarchaeaceae archaeon]|jgi:hypothetical protein